MDITILIADDDDHFRELLEDILRNRRYCVYSAKDGKEALDCFFLHASEIDLVILDVMMPKYDGLDVLKEIREYSEVPVMMLTALDDDFNEISGLSFGADDYIAKPFKYGVFLARVESLTRRAKKKREETIEAAAIKIEQLCHKVFVKGKEVYLSNKEYQLLLYFLQNPGIVLTREQMLTKIWGYDFAGDSRTVDTHIKTLRAKLEEAGNYIQTVRGSGYCFQPN